jgi:molecular chaperone DnaJ
VSTQDYVDKDFYATLGVAKDASSDEIKKAYRTLARKYHPDVNEGDAAAADRFKEISEAYDVLSDEQTRAEYDEARALFSAGGRRFGGAGSGWGGDGGIGGVDLGDLFGGGAGAAGAGGIGDIFQSVFGQAAAGGRRSTARRGQDVETDVRISFTAAVHGTTVGVRMARESTCSTCMGSGARPGSTPKVCPLCGGSGHVNRSAGGFALSEPCRECRGRGRIIDDPCPTCEGDGAVTKARTLNVRVPAGVKDGQRIRLSGRGGAGTGGGPAGDLYVVVNVDKHPVFGRKGANLTLTLPVTFAEAALGAEIAVPTLGGPTVTLRIPAGTSNGRTFRVRGRGVPRKGGEPGDLLVTVEVAVPQKLDAKAKELLETFREATRDHDPRAGLVDLARSE